MLRKRCPSLVALDLRVNPVTAAKPYPGIALRRLRALTHLDGAPVTAAARRAARASGVNVSAAALLAAAELAPPGAPMPPPLEEASDDSGYESQDGSGGDGDGDGAGGPAPLAVRGSIDSVAAGADVANSNSLGATTSMQSQSGAAQADTQEEGHDSSAACPQADAEAQAERQLVRAVGLRYEERRLRGLECCARLPHLRWASFVGNELSAAAGVDASQHLTWLDLSVRSRRPPRGIAAPLASGVCSHACDALIHAAMTSSQAAAQLAFVCVYVKCQSNAATARAIPGCDGARTSRHSLPLHCQTSSFLDAAGLACRTMC